MRMNFGYEVFSKMIMLCLSLPNFMNLKVTVTMTKCNNLHLKLNNAPFKSDSVYIHCTWYIVHVYIVHNYTRTCRLLGEGS